MALKPVGRSRSKTSTDTAVVAGGNRQEWDGEVSEAVKLLEAVAVDKTVRLTPGVGAATPAQIRRNDSGGPARRSAAAKPLIDAPDRRRVERPQDTSSAAKQLRSEIRNVHANAEATSRQATAASVACDLAANSLKAGSSTARQHTSSLAAAARSAAQLPEFAAQAARQVQLTRPAIHDVLSSGGELERLVKRLSAIARDAQALSFNATMEAARPAGGASSFAVIANEFQTLARRLTRTAKLARRELQAMCDAGRIAASEIDATAATFERVENQAMATSREIAEQHAAAEKIARDLSEAANALREATIASNGLKQTSDRCVKATQQLQTTAQAKLE